MKENIFNIRLSHYILFGIVDIFRTSHKPVEAKLTTPEVQLFPVIVKTL
jgi:hypothetical protein